MSNFYLIKFVGAPEQNSTEFNNSFFKCCRMKILNFLYTYIYIYIYRHR